MRSFLAIAIVLGACGSNQLDWGQQTQGACLGLEKSWAKSVDLAFDGYDGATGPSIDPQTAAGDAGGSLTITGQVMTGASMDLVVGMTGYSDGPVQVDSTDLDLTYRTGNPKLSLVLSNLPNGAGTGDLSGTLVGSYLISGDIDDELDVNLTITGQVASDAGGVLTPVPGGVTVTGNAIMEFGGAQVSTMF